ncbi:MAG TPA: c-type cytochrome [Puia sp.]|nr:c-type cytochrome [Puia sp.]
MKIFLVILVLIGSTLILSSFTVGKYSKPLSTAFTFNDSLEKERLRFARAVLESVKDKKDMPASEVFKNVQTFTNSESVKAVHFIGIMNYWGEALGVSCTHCHNTTDWASDEKMTKQIARDMYALRQTVNGQILQKIKGLQTPNPQINCGTCHRGKIKPEE